MRSYRDYDSYDREAREPEPAVAGRPGSDPLADLARIIGQDDGYADLLKAVARTRGSPADPAAAPSDAVEDEIAIPAMPLRAPASDDQGIDWEDLEAELTKHREAAQVSGADDGMAIDALRGSHEAWPGEAAAADDLERRLAAEFERSFGEGERLREGHTGAYMAAGAVGAVGAVGVAGAAGAVYAMRAHQPREPDVHATPPQGAVDGDVYAYPDDAPPRRRRAGVTAVVTIVALALIGGGGVFAYRAMDGSGASGGEPRIVRADSSPVRVAAPQAQESRPVADRAAGADRVVTREERPVSVREQAAQVQEPPTPARVIPLFPAPAASSGVVTDPGQPVVRTVNAVPVTAPAAPLAAAPIQSRVPEEPRRVRTVQVGPDGTIKTPSQSAPARPAVPVAPQPALSVVPASAPALAAADARSSPVPAPRPVQTIRVARAEPVAATSVEPSRAPARPVAQTQPLDLGPQRTASVSTGSTSGGGTFVQISSHQSDQEARTAFTTAVRRFPMLQGQTPNVRTAEIPGRGTWHRLRVGPFSRDEAQGLCQRLRTAGGSCVLN
ncbi:MAG: SPOR domain-containing protein [Phreatobacter sp.]|uniref:SPOR domain-containing protein n=1 Tax=Phreatobacter sp. TaxID=1966341 RepID=UPI002735D1E3|nr:SPOR domain-containing protein [Phreatobacter sp.]MDP2801240.1 SPOR domain-containing protein [Phreatobacter sp.]